MFIERGIFVTSKKYIFDHLYCKPNEWKHETISSLHVLVLFDLHLYYYIIYMLYIYYIYVYIIIYIHINIYNII